MSQALKRRASVVGAVALMAALQTGLAAQTQKPVNDLPNPYQGSVLELPGGRTWGATSGIAIDRDGKSVWAIDRCGANSCVNSELDPILKFDANGKLVRSFGKGLFVFPHGIYADNDGNVWVTDMVLRDGRGQGATGKGQQVIKFSPEGKELLRLGKAGVGGNGIDTFSSPSAVVVGRNGDIFVADGHAEGTNERIMKFDRNGKFIKQWGKPGFGKPGTHEFSSIHDLAMDSRGRLFIADRDNNRIQIYDQDGNFLESWEQFSRPSGIDIDRNDNIYVADSETGDESIGFIAGGPAHKGWKRGIRVGSAKDGSVRYFIPDPAPKGGTSAAEGVAADRDGVIYGAEVGPRRVMKYVRK
jgi:sugar lactone lactonase YvrE